MSIAQLCCVAFIILRLELRRVGRMFTCMPQRP